MFKLQMLSLPLQAALQDAATKITQKKPSLACAALNVYTLAVKLMPTSMLSAANKALADRGRATASAPSSAADRLDGRGRHPAPPVLRSARCASSPSSATARSSSRPRPSPPGCARVADEVLVHTGQHYDDELSRVFFDELALPRPEHRLRARAAARTPRRPRGCSSALAPLLASRGARRRCSSTATRTRRWRARWRPRRPGSRSRTSRPGCARTTARCPRSSTAS